VTSEPRLLVNEIFGPTFQGEGRQTGQRCAFLRLGGCNLHCSWCDTPYTWVYTDRQAALHRAGVKYDPKTENRKMTIEEVWEALYDVLPKPGLVVISGGEPLLQWQGLQELVLRMWELNSRWNFAIETSGSVHPQGLAEWGTSIQWTVSPKLSGSGNEFELRHNEEAILTLMDIGADFKFVVTDPQDLLEVRDFAAHIRLPEDRVWLMPEGTTVNAVLENGRRCADAALSYGWNLTLRQHVLLFGDERGK